MVAWRYEISLLVLKNIFQHSQRNFVFPRGHVISFIEPAGRGFSLSWVLSMRRLSVALSVLIWGMKQANYATDKRCERLRKR